MLLSDARIPRICPRCRGVIRRPDIRPRTPSRYAPRPASRPVAPWYEERALTLNMARGPQYKAGVGPSYKAGTGPITVDTTTACCCSSLCYYQLVSCATGTAVNKWVDITTVGVGDVIRVNETCGCFTVSSTQNCSSPSSIVTVRDTMANCTDARCNVCSGCGSDPTPCSWTVVISGVTLCASLTGNPNGTFTLLPTTSSCNWAYTGSEVSPSGYYIRIVYTAGQFQMGAATQPTGDGIGPHANIFRATGGGGPTIPDCTTHGTLNNEIPSSTACVCSTNGAGIYEEGSNAPFCGKGGTMSWVQNF
jgi:hypothetical protein